MTATHEFVVPKSIPMMLQIQKRLVRFKHWAHKRGVQLLRETPRRNAYLPEVSAGALQEVFGYLSVLFLQKIAQHIAVLFIIIICG